MERQKRATGSEENEFWGNPCDYVSQNNIPTNTTKLVHNIALQAKITLASALQYKDTFASKLHSEKSFDTLLSSWQQVEWLKNIQWYRNELLPKEKVLYQLMPVEYINRLTKNEEFDRVLPILFKGLKLIVASFYQFVNVGLKYNNIINEDSEALVQNINKTMYEVRAMLCLLSDLMRAKQLKIEPLLDSEVPEFRQENTLSRGLLLYRDTLNYVEYIEQIFEALNKMNSKI